jgi:tetratricopeptide (TPR) repeat protein
MKATLASLFCIVLCFISVLDAQAPVVQLKITERSGFLGIGGPRIVQIELSNQTRQFPLTCDNVNSGQYYYFLVKPANEWQLTEDIVKENVSKILVSQNDQKNAIAWQGDLVTGDSSLVLLGFPKSIKLSQPFFFQCPVDETIIEAQYKVPQELWPGYSLVTKLADEANIAISTKRFRQAIGLYENILGNDSLRVFPQYDEAKERRTKCFGAYYNDTWSSFESAVENTQLDLKSRIALVDGFRPEVKYILDSLPRAAWGIGSLDSTVVPILDKCRSADAQIGAIRDSLQRVLDDQNIRWIVDGSTSGKNGYLYIYMIETLASAFSSLDFGDTTSGKLKVRIPEDYQARLAKYNITESYQTFIRICNERYQTHLPIFPIDFLPNLKKDSAAFPLPYYSMLKAVNDYYYGNYASARDEIYRIFRTCYEPELNYRFDMMRVIITMHDQHVSLDILKMLDDAEQMESKKDVQNALDKYRQITLVAPNFAYGSYMLGKFYSRTGDQIRAIYSFQKAYQIDTLFLSAYRECYNLYQRQGNFKPIIEVLTTALAKKNEYWEINYDLGVAYLGDADPARAIQSFERALALSPKSYKTNIQLGLAYQNVKNYQKAREYFNNAIGLDPTRQEAVDYLTKLNELQRTGK